MTILLNKSDIQDFQNDGVVILRGVFNEWIDILTKGAEHHIGNPSESALIHKGGNYEGKFLEDFCNWRRIPEYSDFVLNSPLAPIAAGLMESTSVQFFHDHFFYKEALSGTLTPWHQDLPYYCVSGHQTVSFWLPLEPREKSVSLKSLAVSIGLQKKFGPPAWLINEGFIEIANVLLKFPIVNIVILKLKK